MRYWLLAAVSASTAFALFAFTGSLLARLGASILAARVERGAPAARARLLFLLRILPGFCAAIAAFAIALPIFLWFEDTRTTEPINRTLAVVGFLGALLLARSLWRAAAACRATARVVDDWERRGRPLVDVDAPLPAFAIEDPFPVVAVIGMLRPRLFVAERVLRECSPAEVAAMIAHECAHVSARDNLKRLVIRACPSAFGVARRLDRAWNLAAEEAADARAAAGDPRARLNLADALIHVARLAAPRTPPLASAFYLGGSVEARVRCLVDPPVEAARSPWAGIVWPAATLGFALLVLGAAPGLHALMERAIRLLP